MQLNFTEHEKFLMSEFLRLLPTISKRLNVSVIACIAITSDSQAAVLTCPGFDPQMIEQLLVDMAKYNAEGNGKEYREYSFLNFKPGTK